MAQEELILTDDLLNIIKETEKGFQKLYDDIDLTTSSVKKLSKGINMLGNNNTFSSISKASDYFKKTTNESNSFIKVMKTLGKEVPNDLANTALTARNLSIELEKTKNSFLSLKNIKKVGKIDASLENTKDKLKELYAIRDALSQNKPTKKNAKLLNAVDDGIVNNVLNFSDNAKSINDRAKAIENMRKAYNKLDPSVKGNEVKMARLNLEIKKQESALRRLQGETAKTSNAMGQWASRLGALFGINAISNFVRKMVTVRGEFELQQKSLEVLLKSKSEANKLWEQTMQLAVKSPFQVGQLITYTKQLAAYQIETDKLFDTTKRLADLSAGLGVDMDRLILAYGQVRTAEYLRATEVRQFTEAGVPLLDALADRFSALEGKAVSVAEVMERITKRQVTFGDVEAVINQMTDLGGLFYNMQEEQSKTVKGMISNLKDEISLMFNEIGESSEGTIKRSLQVVRWLIQHWEVFGVVLTGLISSLGVYKLAMLASNYALEKNVKITNFWGTSLLKNEKIVKRFGKSLPLVANGLNRMQLAFKGVGMAMKTFLPAAILVGITELVFWLANIGDAAEEAQEKIDEGLRESIKELNKLSIKFFDEKDLESQKQNLKSLIEFYEDAFGEGLNIEIDNLNSEEIIAKFNELKPIIEEQLQFNAKVGYIFEDLSDKAFSDGIREDIKDLEASSLELEKTLTDLIYSTDKLTDKERKQWNDKIKNAKTYNEYAQIADDLAKKLNEGIYSTIDNDLKEATDEFNEFFKSIEPRLQGLTKGEKEIKIKAMLNELALKEQWNDFTKWLAFDCANKNFKINIIPEVKMGPESLPDLMQWQDEFNAKLASFQDKAGITGINTIETTAEKKINELSGLLTEIEKDIERKKADARDLANISLSTLENQRNTIKEMLAFLGVINNPKKSGRRKGAESLLSRRIELIKKMQSEYEKLNDYMPNTTALERVKERFAEAAKELNIDISDIEFATPEDVKKAFRRIKTASKKEKAELEKTIGDIQLDLEIKDAEKKLEVLKSEIDNLFTQYDSTIELQKLDVPPQLMKDLFGLDSTSLSDIRKRIEKELSNAKAQGEGNEKIVKALEADLKKLEEKEKQHLENRLKEYVKFTRNAMSENAKLKYEELKALADIENTFEEAKQGKTEDEKARIEEAKQQAILGYQKQTTEKMQELQWQAFKNSDMFASIFNDLDTVSDLALSNMIAQLENYKEEWSDLPINEMKEVINQIEKMQNAMNKRKALANPFKDTKVYSKQNVETAEHNISSATIENQELTQQIADLEVIIQLENEHKDAKAQIKAFQEKYNTDLSIGAGIKKAELEDQKKYNDETITQSKNIINNYELQKLKLQEQANIYKEIDSQAQKLYDAFKDLSEVLGADDDSAVAIFADMGMSMASTVLQTLALQAELQAATVAAGTFGAAMNTAMGIIGWIVMAVQLITAGLKAAFDVHDKSKQREIENLQEHIDSLEKSYEELSEAMDMAYSMDRMSNAYRMAQATIESQKKAIKEQIKLEKEKWNTDEEKVKEYEEQLEGLDKQSEDLKQQLIDSMGGITDTSSKAREFVDAWVDAFKETGDGLSGLEQNFDEFFDNLIREQISKQVIGSITDKFAKEVEKAITENGDSGEITDVEWRQLQQSANASKEQMNNAMQMYRQFFEESGAGLSGLQEGIKGITESQADIIASYLNSIRMFVSEKTSYAREIRNILMGINGQPNPMLDELKRVAKHTENIRDLLLKVSDPISNTLKVSIYQ